jgi:hypothetical protein
VFLLVPNPVPKLKAQIPNRYKRFDNIVLGAVGIEPPPDIENT